MKIILVLSIVFGIAGCAENSKKSSQGDGDTSQARANKSSTPKDSLDELDQTEDKPIETSDFDKSEVSNTDLKKLRDAYASGSETRIIAASSEILSRDSKNIHALNTLALHYFKTNRLGMAKILLKRALADHPKTPTLYNNMGIIYLASGEMRLALESFRKSVDLKSSYQIGATNLGSIYVEHFDYSRSLAPLENSFDNTKSDLRRGRVESVEIANNYAIALMGVGDNAKAEKVFERIYEANVRNPTPILNYAILLVEVLKKKKDAVRVISKLKFISTDPQVLRQVTALERKLGTM